MSYTVPHAPHVHTHTHTHTQNTVLHMYTQHTHTHAHILTNVAALCKPLPLLHCNSAADQVPQVLNKAPNTTK